MLSIGTVVLASGNLLNYLIGTIVIVFGLYFLFFSLIFSYNVFIVVLHPAFKQEGRKITDDPTLAYSAGESVEFTFESDL